MESIITVVGFLGAGKTTLLRYLIAEFIDNGWNPFIILNDYENANMDAQQLTQQVDFNNIKALSGSCICCSGIMELRNIVNRIPKRENGITLIEANGTSDACSLMEFLGVGLNDRFLPPIQISVVDVKNWQKRGEHNELESNQIQISSLIVLTHLANTGKNRQALVIKEIKELNPMAKIITMDNLDVSLLLELLPSTNGVQKFEHQKTHWSSCSSDLPNLPNSDCIYAICKALPKCILRVKGCTKIEGESNYTYFERTPDGEVFIRPFKGVPITGTKLLTIGQGSDPYILEKAIKSSLNTSKLLNK
ncbi:G3E family GTPase [Aquimarina sp. MAR_2010_214]|uniref:GTP-binding protein n=1 Tax=Aquimarina sp. MAR_2010_214 TaxID=1250026 RepID=UPI000C70CED0|nr:GTP-binding protein [Aquimarina sp. MAR_2010_214]PKV51372.1 G3E family GTPase [Aquimarina sp. MAR_2010_214]